MTAPRPIPLPTPQQPAWRKQRRLVREGFKDLAYMPPGRDEWNATLAAVAFGYRRAAGAADLNLWAAMHAVPPSRRWAMLGERAAVLWHGTSARRAEKVREVGLFHKRGVWSALEPRIAHGYTRGRSMQFQAGSAMVVLVVDRGELVEGRHFSYEGPKIVRFHGNVPREWIEYILWDDRVEFVGAARAAAPKPWAVARFKRREGRWVPHSRPPVRFDRRRTYRDRAGWLELSVRRVFETLGSATAVEVFSSLYATIDPWKALQHEEVFAALDRLCDEPRPRRGGERCFALRAAEE
jgi:hypothetical protein